jgi:hypothetical protein
MGRLKSILIFSFVMTTFQIDCVFAIDEATLLKSASKVEKVWKSVFENFNEKSDPLDATATWKYKPIKFSHDIKKSDSIKNPYNLTLLIDVNETVINTNPKKPSGTLQEQYGFLYLFDQQAKTWVLDRANDAGQYYLIRFKVLDKVSSIPIK